MGIREGIAEKRRREERTTDLLYRNLDHVSSAYFTAEGVYPFWESVFALIVGQLFIAYFSQEVDLLSPLCVIGPIFWSCQALGMGWYLVGLGAIVSLIWFILVSLNQQYALHLVEQMEYMEGRLQSQLEKPSAQLTEFTKPYLKSKENWPLGNIFWGTRTRSKCTTKEERRYAKIAWIKKLAKSTWFYRRILPFGLFLFWIRILNQLLCVAVLIIILVWFYRFDPGLVEKSPKKIVEAGSGKDTISWQRRIN
jgi:hypothetical protein